MDETWYLVASKPRQELRAVEHLTNQDIRWFMPELEVEKIKKGRVTKIKEPMFPGYIFLQIRINDPVWSKIRSTRGIRDFVRFSGVPAQVPNRIIEDLKQHLVNEPERSHRSSLPKPGEMVTINHGAFKGLDAIFQSLNGEERAILLLDILGKQQRLDMKLEDISQVQLK